jgi:hypothetical protein
MPADAPAFDALEWRCSPARGPDGRGIGDPVNRMVYDFGA